MNAPLVEVRNVHRRFKLPREHVFKPAPSVHALRGVSLSVQTGKSLGIVGESGSGKSTLARIIMALDAPTEGSVWFESRNLHALRANELRQARRGFQMVFQDPYGSLDPRMKVQTIVSEPLLALGDETDARLGADARHERVGSMLRSVGLSNADMDKYPHEFSGGQRQRIAIARALITQPKLIVADEPVSALDVSVQAQVLNLLRELQQHMGITFILISHDLAVVRHLCEHVAVMQNGLLVEQAATDQLFEAPQQDYTKRLLAAAV
jgi:ABC-type microcin C transport system duplicated ATPase subunit YejF